MPYYPPLCMPEAPEEDRGLVASLTRLLSFPSGNDEAHLLNQIKVRDPIPPEVWGENPDRAAFASEVSSIIARVIDWPNGHFIPEDPFESVIYAIGGDDLVHTELAMALEENLGIVLDEMDLELFSMWTFGEVVEYMRSDRTAFGTDNVDCRPLPLSGPLSIEVRNCAKLATFIDIRRVMNMGRSDNDVARVTPSTNVRELDESKRRRLDWFVSSRFGTGVTPLRVYVPMRTALVSITSTVMASSLMGLFMFVATLFFGANIAETILFAGLFAAFGAVMGASIASLELLFVLATRDYWRVRSETYRRVQTVRELVDWVVARRAALLAQT